MKYRVVFCPWERLLPYQLEKFNEKGYWEYCSQRFLTLEGVDQFIEDMRKGEEVVREFEL